MNIQLKELVTRETVQASGKRRYRKHTNGTCANQCGRPKRSYDAYCPECRAEIQSAWQRKRTAAFNELKAKVGE